MATISLPFRAPAADADETAPKPAVRSEPTPDTVLQTVARCVLCPSDANGGPLGFCDVHSELALSFVNRPRSGAAYPGTGSG